LCCKKLIIIDPLLIFAEAPRGAFLSVEGRRAGAWLALREGAPLSARCEVEGGRPPPSSFEWWLEGAEGAQESLVNVSNGAQLVLDRVSRDWHNASLVCAATHPAIDQILRVATSLNISCKYTSKLVFYLAKRKDVELKVEIINFEIRIKLLQFFNARRLILFK